MQIESKVMIRRTPEQVWSFLEDISNIPKWDRGVAAVTPTSPGPPGEVGFEFDTFAPLGLADKQNRGRMSYRIAEIRRNCCTIQLTSSTGNARFFRTAQWQFRVEPAVEGALLTCTANFVLRFRYLILAPVLYAMKGAIHRDLLRLKRILEENSRSHVDF